MKLRRNWVIYESAIYQRAEKNFASLSREEQGRIVAALNKFQTDQRNCDLKKLKGQIDTWRLRVGDFRDMGEPEGAIIPLFSNRGYMDPLSFSLGINNQV
jgi:hypothetical protein